MWVCSQILWPPLGGVSGPGRAQSGEFSRPRGVVVARAFVGDLGIARHDEPSFIVLQAVLAPVTLLDVDTALREFSDPFERFPGELLGVLVAHVLVGPLVVRFDPHPEIGSVDVLVDCP